MLPGTYTVRVHARKATLSVPLRVRLDPQNDATISQLRAQYDALGALPRIRSVAKYGSRGSRGTVAKRQRLRTNCATATAAELGLPTPAKVIDQIAYLRHIIATAYDGPTTVQTALMQQYHDELDALGKRFNALPSPTPSPKPSPKAAEHRRAPNAAGVAVRGA